MVQSKKAEPALSIIIPGVKTSADSTENRQLQREREGSSRYRAREHDIIIQTDGNCGSTLVMFGKLNITKYDNAIGQLESLRRPQQTIFLLLVYLIEVSI